MSSYSKQLIDTVWLAHKWSENKNGLLYCYMPSCRLEVHHTHDWDGDERVLYQWSAVIYLHFKDEFGNRNRITIEEGNEKYNTVLEAQKAAILWYVFGIIED